VIQKAANNLQEVVSIDNKEIWSELIAFPRNDVTVHGYPFWDTHAASALLEGDFRAGKANEVNRIQGKYMLENKSEQDYERVYYFLRRIPARRTCNSVCYHESRFK